MNQQKHVLPAGRAFTLVELLVVIAIIAILMTMLLPALKKARGKAHQITCASNLKQLSAVQHSYVSDFDGYWVPYKPDPFTIAQKLTIPGYLKRGKNQYYFHSDFDCPSNDIAESGKSYLPSIHQSNVETIYGHELEANYATKLVRCTKPSEKGALSETAMGAGSFQHRLPYYRWVSTQCRRHSTNGGGSGNVFIYDDIHSGGMNIEFIDGHVEWRSKRNFNEFTFALFQDN